MRISRESIYAALWARVSVIQRASLRSDYAALYTALTGNLFVTQSRRLQHWNDVAPELQPAIFMIENREVPQNVKGIGARWDMDPELFIYDNCGGGLNTLPGQRLNALVDAVDDALAPDGRGYQTLGGLVSHCWVAGVELYEGYKGMMDQSVAIVKINIRVPDSSGPV